MCTTEGKETRTTVDGHSSTHAGSLDVLCQEQFRNEQMNDFQTVH